MATPATNTPLRRTKLLVPSFLLPRGERADRETLAPLRFRYNSSTTNGELLWVPSFRPAEIISLGMSDDGGVEDEEDNDCRFHPLTDTQEWLLPVGCLSSQFDSYLNLERASNPSPCSICNSEDHPYCYEYQEHHYHESVTKRPSSAPNCGMILDKALDIAFEHQQNLRQVSRGRKNKKGKDVIERRVKKEPNHKQVTFYDTIGWIKTKKRDQKYKLSWWIESWSR